MSTLPGVGSASLIYPGEPMAFGGWQVSNWNAGQSSLLRWGTGNVRPMSTGGLEFALSPAPRGSQRPYLGGEVQSVDAAATGTWSWRAQAPRMADGAVFGMFTYRADHFDDPWIEFDFEFVGANTAQVRLNIHMETATGEHVTLEQAKGGPVIVDLGFDAAQGAHAYEVKVTATEVVFRVDGLGVGRFGASDMPHGAWTTGRMKSFVNLWCVDPPLESWGGRWIYPDTPLVARVEDMGYAPMEGTSSDPDPVVLGSDEDSALVGTDADHPMHGSPGHDSLSDRAGSDRLRGDRTTRLNSA